MHMMHILSSKHPTYSDTHAKHGNATTGVPLAMYQAAQKLFEFLKEREEGRERGGREREGERERERERGKSCQDRKVRKEKNKYHFSLLFTDNEENKSCFFFHDCSLFQFFFCLSSPLLSRQRLKPIRPLRRR